MMVKKPISVLLFSLLFLISHAQTNYARRGLIDLRNFDFAAEGHIALSGEWELYMSNLIAPESFDHAIQEPGDFIPFPSTWDETSKSLRPGKGYATYHLKILVKPNRYSLELPHFYSGYKLWINHDLIAHNGQVGTSAKISTPQWLPQTVAFTATQDTLDLVIQVSNFHHAKGGVRENILIGTTDNLTFKRQVAVSSNLTLFGGLVLLSLVFVFVYMFVKQDNASIFFAALCVTWALRSVFSNLYVVTAYLPDFPWEICVKIEYVSLYLTMIWAVFFLASLFPADVNNLFKYFFIACNIIFILFTCFTNASLYTQFLPVYLSFCLILLIYIIYVLIHAVVYERHGVWLIVSCIMLGVIIFAYDLSAYQGLASYNPIIINIGYLGMFILMGTCLAFQLGFLKRNLRNRDMLTYDDLYGSSRNK
jgi:hypothetical protein